MMTDPTLGAIGVVTPMIIGATTPDIVAIMTTVVTEVMGIIATVCHIMALLIQGALQAMPIKAGATVGHQESPITFMGTAIAGCPSL